MIKSAILIFPKNSLTKEELNTKPYNQSNQLGKPPEGNLDDIILMEELIQCIDAYKEIVKDLEKEENLNSDIEIPLKNNFYDLFDFCDKTFAYGENDENKLNKNQFNEKTYENEKNPKKNKILMENAPKKSMVEKSELPKYNEEKHIIRKPNVKFEFNVPEKLKLNGIADFNDLNVSHNEDYLSSQINSNKMNNLPKEQAFFDDLVAEVQTPIDFLKNYNLTKRNINQNNNIPNNNNNINKHPNNETILSNSKIIIQNNNNDSNMDKKIEISTSSLNPQINIVPNVPSVPKIPEAPKLKLLIPNIVINNADNKVLEKRGSLMDEIRSTNPLSRLKKVPANNIENQPNNKKKDVRSASFNPHMLLKQAIQLRYQQINKIKNEDED